MSKRKGSESSTIDRGGRRRAGVLSFSRDKEKGGSKLKKLSILSRRRSHDVGAEQTCGEEGILLHLEE